jgi:hypothetical protein
VTVSGSGSSSGSGAWPGARTAHAGGDGDGHSVTEIVEKFARLPGVHSVSMSIESGRISEGVVSEWGVRGVIHGTKAEGE